MPAIRTLNLLGKASRSALRSNRRLGCLEMAERLARSEAGSNSKMLLGSFASNDRERARLRTFVTLLLGKAHRSSWR